MEIRQYHWKIKKTQYIKSYGIWLKQCSERNLLQEKAEKYELSVQLKKLDGEQQNKSKVNIRKQDWQREGASKHINNQGDIITHKADLKNMVTLLPVTLKIGWKGQFIRKI